MLQTPQAPPASLSRQEIEKLIDSRTLAADDQFHQNLMLTVQAVLHLHIALDGKFTRKDASEV